MNKICLVWAAFLLATPALADDQPVDLDAITVEASRSNDTAGSMNKDVSVITAQEIADSPYKNIPELLRTVPGVYARVNSNIKDQQVDLGGFGESSPSNVLVLVDGRRLNLPDLSAADLAAIDVNAIDHIEVLQGAATVLYGDNANGGVINIVTKKGYKNSQPSVILTNEVGSYKTNKESMQASGGTAKVGYQFNYGRQQSNNYRTQDNYWADDYNSRVNYDPTDRFGVDFSQGYHLDRYRLPGGISIDQINQVGSKGIDPSRISYGTTSDSHFDVTPRLKFDAGANGGEFSLFTSARKRLTNFVFPALSSTNYETGSYEFQPKMILNSTVTDRIGNKLTGGYDYIYTTEKRRINSNGNPEDIVFASQASHGVYLLDEMTLDERWLFNAGVRGGWADYVFDQKQQTAQKFQRSKTTQGYEGGVGYKYNPDSKVYFNYAHSYRLPVLDEFFQSPFEIAGVDFPAQINSSLTAQMGNQYQIGVRDQTIKNVNLGASATVSQYKNEIYDDPNLGNANYDARTRHYTEEGYASVYLFDRRLEPFASVTFQQSEFVKGLYSGNRVPDVPDQIAHAGITYRPFERISTTVSTDFTGKRFGIGDDANAFAKVKRYSTVDWSVKYGYKNIEVWLSLKNIFDAHYFIYGSSYGAIFGGSEIYYPAPTRNVEGGIKLTF